MRRFWLFVGYASLLGSVGDGALGVYALAKTTCCGTESWAVTVDDFLRNYVGFLYWIKQLAFWVLPAGFVHWVFGLPALLYFPLRVITSAVIGVWAFRLAGRIAPHEAAH
ncbi:MAG: hypothetical protein AAGH76_09200 [Pseudomonadota bacterium]